MENLTKLQKDRWVRALRSGDYKQGGGCLKHAGRYCCLGVLGELEGVLKECAKNLLVNKSSGNAVFLTLSTQGRLATRNDNGISFSEIADWIEAHIPTKVTE